MSEHPGREALRRMVETGRRCATTKQWSETGSWTDDYAQAHADHGGSTCPENVDQVAAYVAELEAQVAEARDIFLVHRDDTTTEAMVDEWLARTAPKEGR